MAVKKRKEKREKSSTSLRFNITVKLTLGFVLILMCLLVSGLGMLFTSNKTQNDYKEALQFSNVITQTLKQVQSNAALVTADVGLIANQRFADEVPVYTDDANKRIAENESLINEFLSHEDYADEETMGYLNSFLDRISLTTPMIEKIEEAAAGADYATAIRVHKEYATLQTEINNILEEMINYNIGRTQELSANAEIFSSSMNGIFIGVIIISCILTLVISIIMSRFVVGRVKVIHRFAEELKDGSVEQPIKIKSNDEFGDLGNALNIANESLAATISAIAEAGNVLNDVTEQCIGEIAGLNDATQDTAAAAEEMSAQIDATASFCNGVDDTVNEVSESILKVDSNARECTQVVEASAGTMLKASQSMQENKSKMMETFGDIRVKLEKFLEDAQSVNEIETMSASILSIAEQTNLLSLNASIEAARAGEAGRGFSVVATEISKLSADSRSVVERIQNVTSLVQQSVMGLIESSNALLQFVQNDVNEDYNEMISEMQTNAEGIQSLKREIEELAEFAETAAKSAESITGSVHSIVQTTNESAKATEIVATKITSITENTGNIQNMMDEIGQASERMKESVARFSKS
ncbi:MAG: methyl-accepting chemotaxis protein [Lachnospiraceae bacterium]|nr:methyl-accepting chemotaxis protein [Lachnospiraceae bacterium]